MLMIARPVRDKIYLQEKCRFFHCGFTVHRSLLTAYCAKRPELVDRSCRRAYRLFSLPFVRFLLNWTVCTLPRQTLIEHCTFPEGLGSNGFSDRRILSFVRTVYSLHHGFPTQTEQPRCPATRSSSVNRNCTVLLAKPST